MKSLLWPHPNPLNKPDVDHIDNDKSNNHKDNLQWVTKSENIQLSYDRDGRTNPSGKDHWLYGKVATTDTRAKQSAKKMGENHPKFKGYYKYKDQLFASMRQLAISLSLSCPTIARMVAKGLIEFLPAKQTNPAISIPD